MAAQVWISHMHADHHTGLLTLLHQRARALACPHCGPAPRAAAGPAPLAVGSLLLVGPQALRKVCPDWHPLGCLDCVSHRYQSLSASFSH